MNLKDNPEKPEIFRQSQIERDVQMISFGKTMSGLYKFILYRNIHI